MHKSVYCTISMVSNKNFASSLSNCNNSFKDYILLWFWMKKQPQNPLVMCANTMERENLSKTGPVMLILGRVSSQQG